MTKLISAQEKNIEVQIEVNEVVPGTIKVDPIILIRVLGILLDNGIEELECLGYGKLIVGVLSLNEDIMFLVQNTVREDIEPIHKLKENGFSTKGTGRGQGLGNISELLSYESRLLLETTVKDNDFIQKLTLTRG